MLLKEKLRKLRKERNLTQEQLAEKLNVSRQAITKWETSEAIPDIENLRQISKFFDISIDELLREETALEIKETNSYHYIKEIEIEHSKHYDINICKIRELYFKSNNEEKVKIELLSETRENLKESLKIDIDDLYNRMDINITSNEKENDNTDVKVLIYLPQKYIDEIEINTKVKVMNIVNLELEKFEFDGALKYLKVANIKGNIVLNASRSDIEVYYDKLEGSLEVNLINSTARVQIPKQTQYKTILKGVKTKFLNAKETEDSKNSIELNGINSKLIIIEKE